MSRMRIVMAWIITLGAVCWIGWMGFNQFYGDEHGALQDKIDTARERVEKYRSTLQSSARQNAEIEQFVERALGGDVETVDHRLRSRLNRVREMVGLEKATVGTGSPSVKRTPAQSLFKGSRNRELREQTDFVELEAWVSGEGSFAQAVELIDRIQAEPWIKRITRVKLDPKGNAEKFEVSVRLVTLFLPGRRGHEFEEFPEYDQARLDQYAGLIAANQFRLPPPPAAPVVVVEAAPAPPQSKPGFPYGQWVLTGVAENQQGVEAWLRNRKSGETRFLGVSERIHEAVFLASRVDAAEFELNGNRFLVAVGSTLKDRKPMKQ